MLPIFDTMYSLTLLRTAGHLSRQREFDLHNETHFFLQDAISGLSITTPFLACGTTINCLQKGNSFWHTYYIKDHSLSVGVPNQTDSFTRWGVHAVFLPNLSSSCIKCFKSNVFVHSKTVFIHYWSAVINYIFVAAETIVNAHLCTYIVCMHVCVYVCVCV